MKVFATHSATITLALTVTARATGFTLMALSKKSGHQVHGCYRQQSAVKKTLALSGILDDVISAEAPDDDSNRGKSDNSNQAYALLFENLIFCGDAEAVIAEQLEACTDTGFIQYLETLETDSVDDDERQALSDLIHAIHEVNKSTSAAEAALAKQEEQKQEEAKRKANLAADDAPPVPAPKVPMSNAEVLQRANAIDQAVVSAESSEDELPPDFIRDAKKEVGLGGFNNKGQMRVGGS